MEQTTQLKKPTYVLADTVLPDNRVFAIFRVVSVEEKAAEGNKGSGNYIVTLGDRTGTLKMFLKDSKYVQICQENDFVEVLNSHAKYFKGFIQLEMDRWGVIRPCDDKDLQKQTEPVKENDLSAIEYELVPSADDREKKQKNKREEHK